MTLVVNELMIMIMIMDVALSLFRRSSRETASAIAVTQVKSGQRI